MISAAIRGMSGDAKRRASRYYRVICPAPVRWYTSVVAAQLSRRLLAELVGTALLVLFGAGSVVAALLVGDGKLEYPGLGMIALTFGLIIAIVIYGFGTTSGAHINPAVSISLAAVRRFPWREVPAYVVAQLVGALLGGLLVVAGFG